MEFLESLQSKFQSYHKKNNIIDNRKVRIEDHKITRINLRTRNMDERRNLALLTPNVARIKTPNKASPVLDRRTKLKIWKQEREKKREQEKKVVKPIFKLGGATNVGFPDLNVESFAPKQHKFKPPKNIRTIPLAQINPQMQRVTRSQKPVASPPLELPKRKKRGATLKKATVPVQNKKELTDQNEEIKTSKRKYSGKRRKSERQSLRRNLFKSDTESTENEDDKENTPMNTAKPNGVYVSPFVSTSRGKGSVRKENLDRSLRGLPSFSDCSSTSTASGVCYFNTVLNNEITRLQELCRVWSDFKEAEDLTDDANDLIDVAVGQATLLMNKKFKQFEGLIRACQTGEGAEKEVTCRDLQGFWDMIYMQVENLNTRFNRLTTLKNNNWKEIEALVQTKVVKKRVPVKPTKSAASSGIRAAILAARKKKLEVIPPIQDESVFNGGFFVIRTPNKNTPNKRTPKPTPKSILKSNKKKSVANLNKSVLFKEDDESENADESVLNTTFEKTPKKKEKRALRNKK